MEEIITDEKKAMEVYNKIIKIHYGWVDIYQKRLSELEDEHVEDFGFEEVNKVVNIISGNLLVEKYGEDVMKMGIRLPYKNNTNRVFVNEGKLSHIHYRQRRSECYEGIIPDFFEEIMPEYFDLLRQMRQLQFKLAEPFDSRVYGWGNIKFEFRVKHTTLKLIDNKYLADYNFPFKIRRMYRGTEPLYLKFSATNMFSLYHSDYVPMFYYKQIRAAAEDGISKVKQYVDEVRTIQTDLTNKVMAIIKNTRYWDYYLVSQL